jgi:hypothetical protein
MEAARMRLELDEHVGRARRDVDVENPVVTGPP